MHRLAIDHRPTSVSEAGSPSHGARATDDGSHAATPGSGPRRGICRQTRLVRRRLPDWRRLLACSSASGASSLTSCSAARRAPQNIFASTRTVSIASAGQASTSQAACSGYASGVHHAGPRSRHGADAPRAMRGNGTGASSCRLLAAGGSGIASRPVPTHDFAKFEQRSRQKLPQRVAIAAHLRCPPATLTFRNGLFIHHSAA